MEEVRATGADTMLTSCPKCVSHFECLKFEGDEAYADIEILDVVSFLARQVNEQKSGVAVEPAIAENVEA
jgi:Fe-S oxidoreductase